MQYTIQNANLTVTADAFGAELVSVKRTAKNGFGKTRTARGAVTVRCCSPFAGIAG